MTNYDQRKFKKLLPQADLYSRPNTRVEYQMFSNDYFTNADVSIYLGDIWVDEIVDFDFSMTEQIMPVYGYASYTADALIKGTRIIQGSFTINFKSTGYIEEVMRMRNPIQELYKEKGLTEPYSITQKGQYSLEEVLKKFGVKSFEELAADYERKIWQPSDGEMKSVNANRPYFNYIEDDEMMDEGFEIKISYGPKDVTNQSYKKYRNKELVRPNETVESLIGVQITGVQKAVSTSSQGAPVLERYTFVAKDLNGTLAL